MPSKKDSKKSVSDNVKDRKINKFTLASLALFLALFIFGINAGEPQRVLEQAWNICLDCIGIG
ncbi:MAG: hypothetical protein DSY80_11115 [Desulfocapsa sp.]|nr:MAG: hypothetical protein DSY80_11115 [Desulfocapsa sp.]